MQKLIKISKLCEVLNLIDPKTKKPQTHTLRFWEKEFSQIKPKKINNQRYYSQKDVEFAVLLKSLIRDEKISISGVKNILKKNTKKLDGYHKDSLDKEYFRTMLKNKSLRILNKINRIKNYGKKNSFKG
tara:strand:- start:183 stop:569 length:387 start_codon:yes stop_codon:yes gene_type:complete